MQFTTLLAALTTTTTLLASPVSPPEKRACAAQHPSRIGFSINYNISKSTTTNNPNALTFLIPTTAAGPCSLVYQFPVSYPITTAGNPQLNDKAIDGPAPGSIVGTTTLVADGSLHTINSFACRPAMGYWLEIAGAVGSVAFSEILGAGFTMTYNC